MRNPNISTETQDFDLTTLFENDLTHRNIPRYRLHNVAQATSAVQTPVDNRIQMHHTLYLATRSFVKKCEKVCNDACARDKRYHILLDKLIDEIINVIYIAIDQLNHLDSQYARFESPELQARFQSNAMKLMTDFDVSEMQLLSTTDDFSQFTAAPSHQHVIDYLLDSLRAAQDKSSQAHNDRVCLTQALNDCARLRHQRDNLKLERENLVDQNETLKQDNANLIAQNSSFKRVVESLRKTTDEMSDRLNSQARELRELREQIAAIRGATASSPGFFSAPTHSATAASASAALVPSVVAPTISDK